MNLLRRQAPDKCAGAQNYNTGNVNALLDIAKEVEPLEANEWVTVGTSFQFWSMESGASHRDISSLKTKFYKLENTR